MKLLISGLLVSLWWVLALVPSGSQSDRYHTDKRPASVVYEDSLRYNVYRFHITAADSGAVRDLIIKAYRGELLLTNFRTRIDGGVVGADVAVLDNNRFPELVAVLSGTQGRYTGSKLAEDAGWLYGARQFVGRTGCTLSPVSYLQFR